MRHDDDGFSYILCANDNCYVKTDGYLNDDAAIKAWNTRKPIDETVEQLEKEKEYQKKNAIDKNFRIGVVNGLNAAIRIVKGGAE